MKIVAAIGADDRPISPGDWVACQVEMPGHPERGVAGKILGRVEATGNGFLLVHGCLRRAARFVQVQRRTRPRRRPAGASLPSQEQLI